MLEKNAKVITISFVAFLISFALYAEPQIPQKDLKEKIDLEPREDELIAIERMIALTENQQKAQKRLKNLIIEIKENKEIFMKGDQSKLHAFYMIKAAQESLSIIRKYHLQHLFSSDFIEELAVLTQVGTKETPAI